MLSLQLHYVHATWLQSAQDREFVESNGTVADRELK
jgi:hypothetical protein